MKKNKPEWQKGCLNGIGGKVEEEDFSLVEAAEREIQEEAGALIPDLQQVGYMDGTNNDNSAFSVAIFATTYDGTLSTREPEEGEIKLVWVDEITKHKYIENVPAIIELCKYYLTGKSHFSGFHLKY